MFTKDNKPEKFKDAETIIGASIKVKGNFQGQGNIVVEGVLEGSLKTEANLFIGNTAKVVAKVESKDAIINGEVRGNVKAKKLFGHRRNRQNFRRYAIRGNFGCQGGHHQRPTTNAGRRTQGEWKIEKEEEKGQRKIIDNQVVKTLCTSIFTTTI